VLPPFGGLVPWRFPADPIIIEQWFQGNGPDPLPAEFAVFHWDEARDLDLYLFAEGGRHLEMTLYDAEQQVIAATSVGGGAGMRIQAAADDEGHIHVPELPPGTYVLAFGPGDFGTTYSVSIGLSDVHCVNQTGAGCGPECGGGCYASVQAAVNAASDGHNVHIAEGTYTDPAGTVAAVTKPLAIIGGYSQDFGSFDPDMYQTVLDAGGGGSVITVTDAAGVMLRHLTLINGDGTGNCGTIGCGGGIYAENAELYVEHSVIVDNVGSGGGRGWGGGVYVDNSLSGRPTTIAESRIENNSGSLSASNGGDGGGIYAFYGGITLEKNEIVGNVACESNTTMCFGGGLYLSNVSYADVLTNVIGGNEVNRGGGTTSWGGGLFISGGSGVYLADNRIEGNRANDGGGGGIDVSWSQVHLTRNRITDNQAGTGGGLYIRSLTPVTLTNNLITDNIVSFRGGGVYLVHSSLPPSQALLVNNTVVNNADSGVATWGYTVMTLTNNLLAGNPVGILTTHPASATITADTNLFWNGSDPIVGANAIQDDPLLTSDYRLRESSPALDAGLNIPGLTTDIESNPRPWDEYDIGAFEGARWEVYLPLVLRDF
jgi:hypothetical protein